MHGIHSLAKLCSIDHHAIESSKMKPFLRISSQSLQILFFVAVWLATDWLVRRENMLVPSGVVGLFLVTALLFTGVMTERRFESGAQWLLAEMPLFFIPPLLSITEFGPVFAQYGVSLLAAVLIGSVFVMSCTGLIVDHVFHLESRWHGLPPAQR